MEHKKIPLQAVVFDMDGLMFDSERIVQQSWNEAGSRLGFSRLGENIYKTLGFGVQKRRQYFLKKYPGFPFEQFSSLTKTIFARIVEEEGLPVKPGLFDLLDYLEKKGCPMAIATSSRQKHAMDNLNRAGIAERFQCIVSGDMVSETKPSPEIYEKACSLLGSQPQRTMALEDAENGIRSAYRAGLIPVLIPDLVKHMPEAEKLAFRRFHSLEELIPFLEEYFHFSSGS